MNGKKWMARVLALVMLLSLCACSNKGSAVFVQSVADLANLGGIAPDDRFAGMVVSENVTEINRDADKTIKELLVKAGDDVKKDQVLFSYDTEQLQLTLDKQRLEKEQLEASIENFKRQIADLEKQSMRVKESSRLQYTVQIQSLQVDLKEAELNLQAKDREVKKSEDVLNNAEVKSPVDGRVQVINEGSSEHHGNSSGSYITIQQSGAYRVKGTLGELQRGGIVEGSRVRIMSRTDESVYWLGTVSVVDYESPTQGNQDNYYGVMGDEMTSSSKYPFYIELDHTDGLILGQHVYIQLEKEEGEAAGIPLSMAFLCYDDEGNPYVWAEDGRGKLEKRIVTLGEPNDMMGTVSIIEGLAEEDYIAFPDGELCREGAPVTHEMVTAEEVAAEGGV